MNDIPRNLHRTIKNDIGMRSVLSFLRTAQSYLHRASIEVADPAHQLYCSVAARIINESRDKVADAIGRIEKGRAEG